MSIYQLAKAMGRDYRRVIDGVKKLVDLHILAINETQVKGRKVCLVSVVNVNDLDAALMVRSFNAGVSGQAVKRHSPESPAFQS